MIQIEEFEKLQEENRRLREANENWQACVRESLEAISSLQKQVRELEAVISSQQERIRMLEGKLAKDSHNSSLPPSSDRFIRVPKSLRKKSGKKPGGQPGHQGHALRQVECPDEICSYGVQHCTHCKEDLSASPATVAERRQVIDLPVKRLWVMEHQVEEKQCPVCLHLTRASFPADVLAPVQYGTGIQTVATYLVAGQVVPYARASQLLHDLFGVQLSPASIAQFVSRCQQNLVEWETTLKATLVKARVLHQDETGMRVGTSGWWVHVCATEHLTQDASTPETRTGGHGCHRHRTARRRASRCMMASPASTGYRFSEALCNVHHLGVSVSKPENCTLRF